MGCTESCLKFVLFLVSVYLTSSHFNSSPSSVFYRHKSIRLKDKDPALHIKHLSSFSICMSVSEPEELIVFYIHLYCRPSTAQWVLVVYEEVINLTNAHTYPPSQIHKSSPSLSLSNAHRNTHKPRLWICRWQADSAALRRIKQRKTSGRNSSAWRTHTNTQRYTSLPPLLPFIQTHKGQNP